MTRKNMLTMLIALFCAVVVAANVPTEKNPKVRIHEQLQELLADNTIAVDYGDAIARVVFRLNQQGRIEVQKIIAKRKDVKQFIDQKLDGRIIAVDKAAYGVVFTVDVRITF